MNYLVARVCTSRSREFRQVTARSSGSRLRVPGDLLADGPSRTAVWRWVVAVALLGSILLSGVGVSPAAASSHCASQSNAARVRDCETLLGLKDQLRGANGGALNWAGNLAITSWDGVQAQSNKGVESLVLLNKNLKGTLPTALGSLPDLTTLTLSSNQLTGGIPKELGGLSNLRSLTIERNQLSGSIPKELGTLTNLRNIFLSFNKLSGSIPKELGNLSNLRYLSLRDNRLSGSIPKELGNLTNLRELSFWDNQLSGPIPTQLGDLTSLTAFYAPNNRLSGSIPSELGSLSNLQYLQLPNNRLSGQIPAELGNLSSLQTLDLARNGLTGAIPTQLGNLTNLTFLSLGVNKLTGEIPSELGSLSSLTTLWLWDNQLTGAIPSELGSLSSLASLSLSRNKLSGSIPTQLGSLTNLAYLYLQNNQLTGGIPASLGGLSSLLQLSLHRNPMLGGAIPTQLGSLSQLNSLWLDKAGLTGTIPSQLGSLANLGVLALSCNELSGAVPGALGMTGSGNTAGTHIYLQGNDLVDAEGLPLRRAAQLPASLRSAADGGTKRTSPELEVTLTGLCRGDSPPEPAPRKSKSKPPPPPPPLGLTSAARAVLPPDGAVVRLERLDMPGQVLEVAIGSVSADRQTVVPSGVIRDAADGQTYIVVRLEPAETDGRVRRLWVPPDSPLVGQIAWSEIIAEFTVPTAVLAAIPLFGLPTVPGQALRSIDPNDPRIFRWDGETHQWRHVPNPATFQALGLYWCDVTVADPEFFDRVPDALLGPPYPASTEPVRADYPTCRAA